MAELVAHTALIPKKETLYKTAFSPLYGSFIEIVHAHEDDRGEWIYTGKLLTGRTVLFRSVELTRLCL